MRLFSSFCLASFFVIISCSFSSAQTTQAPMPNIPVDSVTKLISYREVVSEKGTKDTLYIRAIAWINSFFANPSDITRVRDRDNGVIKGIHRFKLYYIDKDGSKRDAPICEYSFSIECKEGRYRYTFTEFIRKEVSRQPIERWLDKKDPAYNPQWDDYLRQVDTYIKEATNSMKKAMKPPVKIIDNW
jgi:hypothetical protein